MAGRRFENGIDLRGQRAQNAGQAQALTDLPTWGQVQNFLNGQDWKNSVRCMATGNVNLAAPGASMDGYTFQTGDSFLAPSQTDGTQNSVYVWNGASAAATVRADFAQGEVSNGATVYVENGTANKKKQFTLSTPDPITVGTTSLNFVQTGAGFVYTPGAGITISAAGVIATTAPLKFAQNIGDGSSTSITVTHNLGTTDFEPHLYVNATGEAIEPDYSTRTTTQLTMVFGTAPASAAYRVVCIG